MNWETIGWWALAISGAVIIASFFVARPPKQVAPPGTGAGPESVHPILVWLEFAWPVFFIACMGMLTLREVMSFAAVLLLATVTTGAIWAVDHFLLRKKRLETGEPVLVEMARSFFPVLAIVFLLRSFLYEPFKIPSESMLPTLEAGDFILVNKFTYGIRIPVLNEKITEGNAPKRGDVMVFRYPVDPRKDFIKRIVGIPGDVVTYKNKRLTVNGTPIPVSTIGSQTHADANLLLRRFEVFGEKLGEKEHRAYVDPQMPTVNLGGVRNFPNAENCEYNNEGVTCKVPAGHYFMMGDNRDNSDDSRYWGFVPERNIVGQAVLIWMNFGAWKRVGTRIE